MVNRTRGPLHSFKTGALMSRTGTHSHRSSDMLRHCARCTVCGHRGATLHPGWIENWVGWQPFPVEEMSP